MASSEQATREESLSKQNSPGPGSKHPSTAGPDYKQPENMDQLCFIVFEALSDPNVYRQSDFHKLFFIQSIGELSLHNIFKYSTPDSTFDLTDFNFWIHSASLSSALFITPAGIPLKTWEGDFILSTENLVEKWEKYCSEDDVIVITVRHKSDVSPNKSRKPSYGTSIKERRRLAGKRVVSDIPTYGVPDDWPRKWPDCS